ncbi:type I-B CRISPR-associated protein Cas7/Cst2/DevR [Aerosakkonemataceae cyanobacterium BLCC-F50]|uniref:Type I-B CRISPR-associated protein Cas7/Cst2/DevR n=1 Tax=Floridaenema flaviceps BLCC-F50 TaxID=3153642 RepID=A0ABV4XKA6_9CYAN
MTYHLFANLITAQGVAANNRGETEGNRTTLPKVFWNGQLHVSVSAEAIRWAIRYFWQNEGLDVNRLWDESNQTNEFQDPKFNAETYIDDDVLGYMIARAGAGGDVQKRRGALEVTRAVSLESADKIQITFNSKSGDKGKKGKKDEDSERARTSIYSTETITTRFQWGLAITPQRLVVPDRVISVVESVTKISNVGGNHARFLYDFSPESVVFRWTHHPVPQFLNCFRVNDEDILSATKMVQLLEVEEIPADEIWIFGGYAFTEEAKALAQLGCHVYPSLRKGTKALLDRIRQDLNLPVSSERKVS